MQQVPVGSPSREPPVTPWPAWLEGVWAKSPVQDGTHGESLAAHTWQVLSRLRDVARLRPWLPEHCGFPGLWSALFWAALLHDWGKAAAGFQARLRNGASWRHRHEVLSLVFLDWVAAALPAPESLGAAAAIASHHRDPEELRRDYPLDLPLEDDPLAELLSELDEETARGLWRWVAEVVPDWIVALGFDTLGVRAAFPPPVETAVGELRRRGRETMAGWLRRYQRLVRAVREGEEATPGSFPCLFLRGGLLQADHAGSAGLEALPLPELSAESVLGGARLDAEMLYDHQRSAASTVGSAVLTAPTGSGKTEAALLWAAAQVGSGGRSPPRLFYTLPYQASMNAMYDRLERVFPGLVGLVHGRALLALYQWLMDQHYDPGEAARLAGLAHDLADLHYHPVRVLSPYQMLKAVYQLKGYEALLSDLAGAAFVFDEIHAYHPERLAMILETVRYLRVRLGASFFVMTATLPSLVRRRVEDALEAPAAIVASPALFRAFTRHQLRLVAGDLLGEEGLARVVGAFRSGASVLVVCNTVVRAQELFRRLGSLVPPEARLLLHGRFNGRDRLCKEREVLAATGLGANRRPLVVVATQVVEVSLNLDLDVLFSDPAPLEALVQRFGRVNRGRRPGLAPVHVFTEPADGQGVYLPDLVAAALEVLWGRDGEPLDEAAVQDWLDQVYSGERARAWCEKYDRAAAEFRAAFLDNLRPFASAMELALAEDTFERLFDGTEVLPACLEDEYRSLRKERPLEASRLLVPVSRRRWQALLRTGRVVSDPRQWPRVVNVPYTPELGLDDTTLGGGAE